MQCRRRKGGDISTVLEAGLPNITGKITDTAQGVLNYDGGPNNSVAGALYVGSERVSTFPTVSNGSGAGSFGFDASKAMLYTATPPPYSRLRWR